MRRTEFTPVGGSATTEVRQHNGLNQITSTKDGASAKVPFSYDGAVGASNGNLKDDGLRLYEWDALNRLKVVRRKSDNAIIGEYTYDALGRRVRKVVSNGGLSGTIPNGTTDYVYNPAWQCVEERDGTNATTKQYVWGLYIDELIQQKTLVTINGHAAGNYYPLQDLLFRTLALTDSTGDLIEAYDYDAYGNTLIFDAAGTGGNWWADDASQTEVATCEALFTGQRWDGETATYHFRTRYYETSFGRFLSRDSVFNPLQQYSIVQSNPANRLDPSGAVDIAALIQSLATRSMGVSVSKDWFVPLSWGFSLHVTVSGDIGAFMCCLNQQKQRVWRFTGSVEAYGALGFRIESEHRKGGNKPVPDPWNPGNTIKQKKQWKQGQPAGPGFRDRWGHIDLGFDCFTACPNYSWDLYGSLFFRGSAGWYVGAQFNISKPIRTLEDVRNITQDWSFQGSACTGVYGASLELGVGLNFEWYFATEPTGDQCC